MITYDVYEVTFHGRNPKSCLSSKEVYNLVTENGEWYNIACYLSESEGKRKWKDTWVKQALTEIDPWDEDWVDYYMYVFEKTIRNENEEPIETYEIDYAVAPLQEKE